jgi:hypothetical protein
LFQTVNDPGAKVRLPGQKAMPSRSTEHVMIIMPAFAEREKTNDPVVPTLVATIERLRAEDVTD